MPLPAPFTNLFAHEQKSYKMVLILAVLETMEVLKKQEAPISQVRARFLKQLQAREKRGLPVDAPPDSVGRHWGQVQSFEISSLIQTTVRAVKEVLHFESSKQTLRFTDELRAGWSKEIAHSKAILELYK